MLEPLVDEVGPLVDALRDAVGLSRHSPSGGS